MIEFDGLLAVVSWQIGFFCKNYAILEIKSLLYKE